MKFPKTLYVVIEKEMNGSEFIIARENLRQAAEVNETKTVAIYTLDRVAKVTAEAKLDD